jgi:lantibiotic modifying enzyme
VRHIVRPTLLYAEYIYRSLSPALLRDEAARRSALERLLEDDRARRSVGDPERWSAVVRAEREALERLDVPRFTVRADGRDLECASGVVAHDYFDETGLDRLIRRLAEMNEERLGSAEHLIRATLGLSRFRAFLSEP